MFFAHGTVLGVPVGDRLVATAAILPYGDRFGWISMVLVTPQWRRQGLATRLVAACTALLRDSGKAALLDAAPAAVTIYAALGFVPLGTLERWQGPGGGETAIGAQVNLKLDQFAFGADRSFLLEDFLGRPGSVAFPSANGFAIMRRGSLAYHVGPIVAEPVEAQALVTAAIRAAQGEILVDVMEAGRVLIPLLAACNFSKQRCFTRMALGMTESPGHSAQSMAAAGPEFG